MRKPSYSASHTASVETHHESSVRYARDCCVTGFPRTLCCPATSTSLSDLLPTRHAREFVISTFLQARGTTMIFLVPCYTQIVDAGWPTQQRTSQAHGCALLSFACETLMGCQHPQWGMAFGLANLVFEVRPRNSTTRPLPFNGP